MTLSDIIPLIKKRQPGIALSFEHKIFYITYSKIIYLHGKIIPKNKITKYLKKLFLEYGLVIEQLFEWKLYIDCRHDNYEPHNDIPNVLNELSNIFSKGNLIILTNALFDEIKLEYIYQYYPTTACNIQNYYDFLQKQPVNWKSIEIKKHFIALCRRPSIKRVTFIKEILNRYSFDNVTASCGSRVMGPRKPIMVNHPAIENLTLEKPAIKKEKPLILPWPQLFEPYPYPLMIDNLSDEVTQHQNVNEIFFNNLFKLVLETTEDEEQPINLSEKTFKAFAWHLIPIWHSKAGTVAEVRKLGFDIFDDIVDHSYDFETDYEKKKVLIFNELEKLVSSYPTPYDLNRLRSNIFDRLEANNKLLAKYADYERSLSHEKIAGL